MARTTEDSLALFGLDDGLSDAARAAVAGPSPARHSPMTNNAGYAPPGAPGSPTGVVENETATVAVPRDELDRARQGQHGVPVLNEAIDEDESTRAVPREELLRSQDAHVVVGDDAAGDDATLAVAPADNEANSKHLAALAATLNRDEQGGFPPPPGVFPPFGNPHAATAGPMAQMPMSGPMSAQGGPPQSWNDPNQYPGQHQQWNPGGPGSHPNPHGNPMMHGQPMAQGHGSNPHMPVSSPHMQAGQQHYPPSGQLPAHMNMGQGMHGMPMQNQQGPMSYPGQQPQHGGMMQNQPQGASWVIPGPGGKPIKLSGQILLLAVVGVICLAIFITGIVLFATTKF
jgi:hypothetical protein